MDASPAPSSRVATPGATQLVDLHRAGDWDGVVECLHRHWAELGCAFPADELCDLLAALPLTAVTASPGGHLLARWLGLRTRTPREDLVPPLAGGEAWRRRFARTFAGRFDRLYVEMLDLRRAGRAREACEVLDAIEERFAPLTGPDLATNGGRPAFAALQMATTRLLGGQHFEARSLLRAAARVDSAPRFPFAPRAAAALLAVSHAAAGEPTEAGDWLRRAEEFVPTASWMEAETETSLGLTRLLIALDGLDLAEAERIRDQRPSPLDHGLLWPIALGGHVRLHLLTGRPDVARSTCAEMAAATGALSGLSGLPRRARLEAEVRVALMTGAHDELTRLLLDHPDEHLDLHRASTFYCAGAPEQALSRALAVSVTSDQDPRLELLALALVVACQHALEEIEARDLTLDRLIVRVRQSGLLTSLATAPLPLRPLLLAHPDLPVEVARLAAADPPLPGIAPALQRPLTRAETDVLAHLLAGTPRAAIATALHLSENTVKTHLRHVYAKLGATGRQEAIARAEPLHRLLVAAAGRRRATP